MTVTTTTTDQPGADVARVDDTCPPTLAQFITRLQPEIARALPRGMDADRIARLALTVVRQSELAAQKARKPEMSLANCTLDSFAGAILTAAALGLEPGVNGEAWLVPYKGECTLIIGYQGFVKLFWQHPLAKHIDTHAVHERDQFDYAYGLAQFLRHKPAKGDRGKVTYYYAVTELSTGASAFVVLTADEVKALRGGKTGTSGGIADPMKWMERKTALRQLVKLLPKSPTLAAALAVDEQPGSVLREHDVPNALADGTMPALPPSLAAAQEEQAEADAGQRVTRADVFGDEPRCPGCDGVPPCEPSMSCPANQDAEQGTLA